MESRRSPRSPTNISARIRHDGGWDDVAILNISQHGMMLATKPKLNRGAYVEVRRGPYVIIAQIIWSNEAFAGARSQDRISVGHLLEKRAINPIENGTERRAIQRPTEQSWATCRALGQLFERSAVWLIAGLAAALMAETVYNALAEPTSQISAAMLTPNR
ncbi:PilZ domain-containing protein [Sphingomicrobium nitratireducens]|uniref:PilZ domain-containing protein n=1 Tax=Sphingomicrobium nitratireducens TaxID=2964666 RepID=UPI003B849BE1